RRLGLSDDEARDIETAARLHDLGEIYEPPDSDEDHDPEAELSRMRRTLGSYSPHRRRISLGAHLLAFGTADQQRSILLHELAHAMVHHRYPKATAHGREFSAACRQLGVEPFRTVDLPVREWLSNERYGYRCGRCGVLSLRKRRVRSVRCGCGEKVSPERAGLIALPPGSEPRLLGTVALRR
ncbi:MAG: SprT-like domain-containing protein, partial [Chloroflexi bacterium]|nr:SprT-like domain-containing protein [Chloroflexota bacterium]